jgi:hypothetical protein
MVSHVAFDIEIISASPALTRTFPNPLCISLPPILKAPRWIEPDALFAINDHFGEKNLGLGVLFVTMNEKRMRKMMKAVASIARNERSTMFCFACRPGLGQFTRPPAPHGRMLREPWRRVEYRSTRTRVPSSVYALRLTFLISESTWLPGTAFE